MSNVPLISAHISDAQIYWTDWYVEDRFGCALWLVELQIAYYRFDPLVADVARKKMRFV